MLATLLGVCALIAATTALLLRDDPGDSGAARRPPFDRARAERLVPELARIAPPWMSEAERRDWVAARARDGT